MTDKTVDIKNPFTYDKICNLGDLFKIGPGCEKNTNTLVTRYLAMHYAKHQNIGDYLYSVLEQEAKCIKFRWENASFDKRHSLVKHVQISLKDLSKHVGIRKIRMLRDYYKPLFDNLILAHAMEVSRR